MVSSALGCKGAGGWAMMWRVVLHLMVDIQGQYLGAQFVTDLITLGLMSTQDFRVWLRVAKAYWMDCGTPIFILTLFSLLNLTWFMQSGETITNQRVGGITCTTVRY